MRFLVKNLSADVNQALRNGATPLFAAALNGHLEVGLCLAKKLNTDTLVRRRL